MYGGPPREECYRVLTLPATPLNCGLNGQQPVRRYRIRWPHDWHGRLLPVGHAAATRRTGRCPPRPVPHHGATGLGVGACGTRDHTGHRWRFLRVVVVVLVPSQGNAQRSTTVPAMRGGHHAHRHGMSPLRLSGPGRATPRACGPAGSVSTDRAVTLGRCRRPIAHRICAAPFPADRVGFMDRGHGDQPVRSRLDALPQRIVQQPHL